MLLWLMGLAMHFRLGATPPPGASPVRAPTGLDSPTPFGLSLTRRALQLGTIRVSSSTPGGVAPA